MVSTLGFDSVIQDQTVGIHGLRFTADVCLDFYKILTSLQRACICGVALVQTSVLLKPVLATDIQALSIILMYFLIFLHDHHIVDKVLHHPWWHDYYYHYSSWCSQDCIVLSWCLQSLKLSMSFLLTLFLAFQRHTWFCLGAFKY